MTRRAAPPSLLHRPRPPRMGSRGEDRRTRVTMTLGRQSGEQESERSKAKHMQHNKQEQTVCDSEGGPPLRGCVSTRPPEEGDRGRGMRPHFSLPPFHLTCIERLERQAERGWQRGRDKSGSKGTVFLLIGVQVARSFVFSFPVPTPVWGQQKAQARHPDLPH